MVWQSALSLALSLSVPLSQPLAGPQPRHLSHFVHPGPLTPRVACAAILLVQSYQAPFPLVRPTLCILIPLLTSCFPLSSHPPSWFFCLTLIFLTSDARLSWFSCHSFSFSRLAHSTYSTPTFLVPDIPSHLPFFAHTFCIFAMPALPRPAPYSIRPPLASPCPHRTTPLGLPSSPLVYPPAASLSSASPCPPWSSKVVIASPSRAPFLTHSPHAILTLPSHSHHVFLTLHLPCPLVSPALLYPFVCASLCALVPRLLTPVLPDPPVCISVAQFAPALLTPPLIPLSSHPHGPDSGQSSEPFGSFADALRVDKAKALTDTNVELFCIASSKMSLPS